MRTLTEVRHVPELRKNLISMGVLDAPGYTFVVQDGVMKVLKGILTVMKAKRLIGNLYEIEGKTEAIHAAIVLEATSDLTQLWSQRLGHMSERGLKVLADRMLLPKLKTLNLNFFKYCMFGKRTKHN